MANPNIVNVSTITGKTAVQNVITTATSIVSNSTSSNKLIKLNSLVISNIDGSNAADITVDIYRNTTAYKIANTVVVPPDASLTVITKDMSIYLEEGDELRLSASANGDLTGVCSYEEIS